MKYFWQVREMPKEQIIAATKIFARAAGLGNVIVPRRSPSFDLFLKGDDKPSSIQQVAICDLQLNASGELIPMGFMLHLKSNFSLDEFFEQVRSAEGMDGQARAALLHAKDVIFPVYADDSTGLTSYYLLDDEAFRNEMLGMRDDPAFCQYQGYMLLSSAAMMRMNVRRIKKS